LTELRSLLSKGIMAKFGSEIKQCSKSLTGIFKIGRRSDPIQ
jgi:hypothetical protein